ncbi:MAG TPA: septum site-determining protein Ssd [Propionibacteriaceae bacterium]|nr:septum site-determining protein Ssd [Propionibacteriaceae bacterium]
MDQRTSGDLTIVVATADSERLDHVLSILAAVGLEAVVVSDPGSLRSFWSSAAMVLVGVDHAAQVARLGLARRAEVYLLGEADTSAEAYQWSMPLGAAVITLPDHAEWLSDALADLGEPRTESGRVVGVLGGSGGVGASTLAAGLAFTAAREWERSMLVDADRYGGGIDLLVGAERVDGWRWPRLARASGHLGDLGGQLPTVDGIDVLAMARTSHPPDWELGAEPLRAVLGSARRGYELTVVDLPHGAGPAVEEVLRLADLIVLVLRDDLRGVAAGREMLAVIEESRSEVGLVLRQSRPRLLNASVVAEGLGLRLLGTIADDSTLVVAAERGDPPGRSLRSPLAQLCRELLREVTPRPPAETPRLRA